MVYANRRQMLVIVLSVITGLAYFYLLRVLATALPQDLIQRRTLMQCVLWLLGIAWGYARYPGNWWTPWVAFFIGFASPVVHNSGPRFALLAFAGGLLNTILPILAGIWFKRRIMRREQRLFRLP